MNFYNKVLIMPTYLPLFPTLSPATLRRWWVNRLVNHYEISAAIERQKEVEARHNAAYYQKQALLIRLQRESRS